MNKIVFIFLILFFYNTSFSQKETIIYRWEEAKSASPDTIYGISFEKQKLKTLPDTLRKFKNLKQLNLSKNKLSSLPEFMKDFHYLEVLNLDKNDFNSFPKEILSLHNLKELYFSRSDFSRLPDEIDQLTHLTRLDLWSSAITYFPPSLINLKHLEFVDLRGVTYGPTFIEAISTSMNWVKFEYETPCSCVE